MRGSKENSFWKINVRGDTMKERNNELKFLMQYYIKNWRLFVIAILIAVVATSVITVGKSASENDSYAERSEETASLDMQAIKTVFFHYKVVEKHKISIEKALYMQIDASSVNEKILTYSIKAEDEGKKSELIERYKGILNDGELLSAVQQVCADYVIENLTDIIFINDAEEENLLRIKICSYSEESVEKIALVVKDYINSYQGALAHDQNVFEVNLVDEYFIVQREQDLVDRQIGIYANLKNCKVLYDNYYSLLLPEEKKYLNDLEAGVIVLQEADENLVGDDNVLIKDAQKAIGAETFSQVLRNFVNTVIVCIFIYIIIVYIKFAMNARLQTTEELESLFKIKVIGKFTVDTKRRFGKRLDRIIARAMEENVDNDFELAKIKRYFHVLGMEYDKLLIIANDGNSDLLQMLQDDMEGKLIVVSDYMNCSEVIADVESRLCVVMAAWIGKTKYTEITRQIKLFEELQIDAAGAIVIEER